MNNVIDSQLGVAKCTSFSKIYNDLNRIMLSNGVQVDSRNGMTLEFNDFKTIISNPRQRCVGVANRDINIFFLIAEAMWIWSGRKNVKFLTIFNNQMKEYSDDGKNFHAPYGFRLRNWGVSSFDKGGDEDSGSTHSLQGLDQIEEAIKMLVDDPDSRRVVLSIWNPDLDLNTKSKDLPCNDLVFLQHRNGKLNITISNRSNDLHWGLPTNVFQFSWILEHIALITKLDVGTQCHNSKSLHTYLSSDINYRMKDSTFYKDLYDRGAASHELDYKFSSTSCLGRLKEVDDSINYMINGLTEKYNNREGFRLLFDEQISRFYALCFDLLQIYIDYKIRGASDDSRSLAILEIGEINDRTSYPNDMVYLAFNWFFSRLNSDDIREGLRKELGLPNYIGEL